MSQPTVSIGVPVYNAARYLRDALDSLLAQTYVDFEIVISDNGSTDDTESIAREYANRDPRVRYHRYDTNRGSAWNFNNVVHLARGVYFKWHAYDDLCGPDFLQQCVDVLEEEGQVVWCHPLAVRIYSDDHQPTTGHDPQQAHRVTVCDGKSPSRDDAEAYRRFHAILTGTDFCCDSYGLIRVGALRRTRLELPFYGSEKIVLAELALQGEFRQIESVQFYSREHSDASGALQSSSAQQAFVAPNTKSSAMSTRLRLLWGYTSAIFRHRLSVVERMRCLTSVARYLLQFQKWSRVLRQLIGRGAVRGHGFATPDRRYGQRAVASGKQAGSS